MDYPTLSNVWTLLGITNMFGGSQIFVPIILYGLSIKNNYKEKPVLILQGTRQEGYTDPVMAAQRAGN